MTFLKDGWEYKTIDDLSVIDQECLGEKTKRDHAFYYIDISSVSEGKLRLPGDKTIFREAPSRARKVVHRGDVLMSTVRPNLKAFVYFNHTDDECVASTGFAVLTARDGVDARFILHSILSDDVTAQIESLVVGSNYPAISSNAVRRLRVLAPPYPEQARIAEILSTVDRAIEQAEGLIAKQQCIKTGLMQDLLTRGVDEHGNLRSEQTHKFKDSPLGRIPVEWEVKRLSELVDEDITYGIVQAGPNIENGVPYIRTGDMVGETINLMQLLRTSERIAKSYKRSTVFSGDIVFALRATVGKVLPVLKELEGANLTQGTAKISPNDSIEPMFLLWVLQTTAVQDQIRLHQKGTTFMEITLGDLRSIEVAFPLNREEQSLISEKLTKQDELRVNHIQRLQKLCSLKAALMQDLLTGKKRVTALLHDAEVPAS